MEAEPEEASEGDAAYDPEHNHLEPPQGESSQVTTHCPPFFVSLLFYLAEKNSIKM